MKTFRVTVLLACLVGASSLAHAAPSENRIGLNGLTTNRIGLNRIGLNRIGLNRIGLNRIGLNRIGLNRIGLNGIAINGAKADDALPLRTALRAMASKPLVIE